LRNFGSASDAPRDNSAALVFVVSAMFSMKSFNRLGSRCIVTVYDCFHGIA